MWYVGISMYYSEFVCNQYHNSKSKKDSQESLLRFGSSLFCRGFLTRMLLGYLGLTSHSYQQLHCYIWYFADFKGKSLRNKTIFIRTYCWVNQISTYYDVWIDQLTQIDSFSNFPDKSIHYYDIALLQFTYNF